MWFQVHYKYTWDILSYLRGGVFRVYFDYVFNSWRQVASNWVCADIQYLVCSCVSIVMEILSVCHLVGMVSVTLQVHWGYLVLLWEVVYFKATTVRLLILGTKLLLIELVGCPCILTHGTDYMRCTHSILLISVAHQSIPPPWTPQHPLSFFVGAKYPLFSWLTIVMEISSLCHLAGVISDTLQIHWGYLVLLWGVVYFEGTLVMYIILSIMPLLIELVLIHSISYAPDCV